MSQIYSPKEESAIRTATTDDVMNDTLLALESLGTGTWVPFSHKKLPELLYYEQRQGDSLWDPNQGLQTFGKVVGFTWNKNFFANVLDKHLSYPVHSPWVFSPFISANRNPDAFSGRRISDPRSVLLISVGKSIFHNEKLCIYSLRRLVEDFKIPSSKLQYRPYWEDEYLILDHVPIEAIGTIDCAGGMLIQSNSNLIY